MAKEKKPEATRRRGLDFIDLFEEMVPWKRGIVVAAVLLIVLCALMPEVVLQSRIFLVPDTQAPLSFASVGREMLEQGTYPLWNPYLFCGMPSYPSLAYTPYVYPVSFLTHILYTYLGFPEMTWLLLHYLIAGIGVYLLLRSLEVRAAVSLMAAVVFMVMPNYVAAGVNGHGSQACAIAYMPWAILFARNIFRGHRRIPMTAFLAIVLGFQMLRGHVQISYYTYLCIGLLFVVDAVQLVRMGRYRVIGANIACAAVAFAAAIGIAGVLIFPVREYAELSIRGGAGGGGLDYGYATKWSLHPREMLTFFFAWAFGFGKRTYWGSMPFTDYPNYVGIVTFIFAIFSVFLSKNRWKWFFIIAAVLSTLISFGNFFPLLYNPMFKLVPYFNKFRVPVMVLIVQQLALTVLMGLGIEALMRRRSEDTLPAWFSARSMKWMTIVVAAFFIIILVSAGDIGNNIARDSSVTKRVSGEFTPIVADAFAKDIVKTVLFFLLSAAALFLFLSGKLKGGFAIGILAAVSLIDLFIVDHLIVHPEAGWKNDGYRIVRRIEDREDYMKSDPIIDFLKQDSTYFRVFPAPADRSGNWTHGFWSHDRFPFSDTRYMMFRIFSMGGYHAAKLKNYQNLMDVMFASFNQGYDPVGILNMMNAKYVVWMGRPLQNKPYFSLVWNQGYAHIYENTGALPRFFFVSDYRVVPEEETLQALVSPGFDPSEVVLLQRDPGAATESSEGSYARITDYSLNSVSVSAHVEKPCIMVASEIDYPDWRLFVDGREREVLTANYCLRAVALESGDHKIEFVFSSGVLKASLIVSILTFALAVAVPVIHRFVAPGKE